MKLRYTLSALSLVAILAAAPSAMAASATVGATTGAAVGATVGTNGGAVSADTSTSTAANGNVSTDHGVSALGVDISTAGDTATSVQSFTTNLTTEQQANVTTGCKTAMAHPDQASADVLAFCKNSMM